MDVSKLPPSGLQGTPPETAPPKQRLVAEITAALTQDLQVLETVVPTIDRADIRPLDVLGGLQVLLTEMRSAFESIPASMATAPRSHVTGGPALGVSDAPAANPTQAARQIVAWLLESLPQDAGHAPAWAAVLAAAESALQAGLQQTASTLSFWRDVPEPVLDAVKQAEALALQVLSEETPNPLWLRPEWVGLAPRLERLRRRRRAARERLTDPDLWQRSLDDYDEPGR